MMEDLGLLAVTCECFPEHKHPIEHLCRLQGTGVLRLEELPAAMRPAPQLDDGIGKAAFIG